MLSAGNIYNSSYTYHVLEKQKDGRIAYVDTNPLNDNIGHTHIFIHGNPTSSYTWRNVIPHIMPARCIALDLIGMGLSSKPNISYRFHEHAEYLEIFLEKVVPFGKVIIVSHDWGAALGFDWASRHQERLTGFVLFEFVRPFPTWADASQGDVQKAFRSFRVEETGRKLLIEDNAFINEVLVNGITRSLSTVEMEYYSQPFLRPSDREPLYRWPNEVPIEGVPADVNERLTKSHDWLLQADMPTLLFWADPGWVIREEKAQWYLKSLRNAKGVFVGKGYHFLQEDHPHRIGIEISKWSQRI
ncbi:Alpha/Beta hydrolase protein [Trichoderma chlorosporum]